MKSAKPISTTRKVFAIIAENRFLAVALVLSMIFHLVLLSNWLFKTSSAQAVVSGSFTVKLAKLDVTDQIKSAPNAELIKPQNNFNKPAEKDVIQSQSTKNSLDTKKTDKTNSAEQISIATSPLQPLEMPVIPDPNGSLGVFIAPTSPVFQIPPNTAIFRQTSDAYQYVETEFETIQTTDPSNADPSKSGSDVFISSKVIFIKNTEKNTYQLMSTTQKNNGIETTQISSEGEITAFGLKPNHTVYSNGNHTKYTDYYWADGILEEYENKSENNKVAKKLTANTQDELSYLYQFMFSPPTSQDNNSSSPSSQQSIPYVFLGEEDLQTKYGLIKTIHILKNDKLSEETELWLAVEYQYLPVKIRKKNVDGHFTEQVVTNISLSPPPQSDSNVK